jgi:hypothetical protein
MSSAMAIQTVLANGLISGTAAAGMSIIRDLRTIKDIQSSDVAGIIERALSNFISGFAIGAIFSSFGFFASQIGSVIIFRALGGAGIVGSLTSILTAIQDFKKGYHDLAAIDIALGFMSAYGAKQAFSTANSIAAARATAATVTDPSPDNTTTASINSPDDFFDNPSDTIKNNTPEQVYEYLKNTGYDVKPLGGGNYQGVSFEEGGGFRVTWGGDRYLQYHPPGRTHHGVDAYWKTSSGPTGTTRYNMDGGVKS